MPSPGARPTVEPGGEVLRLHGVVRAQVAEDDGLRAQEVVEGGRVQLTVCKGGLGAGWAPPEAAGGAGGAPRCHLPTMRPVCPLVGSYGHLPLPSSKATWSRVKPDSSWGHRSGGAKPPPHVTSPRAQPAPGHGDNPGDPPGDRDTPGWPSWDRDTEWCSWGQGQPWIDAPGDRDAPKWCSWTRGQPQMMLLGTGQPQMITLGTGTTPQKTLMDTGTPQIMLLGIGTSSNDVPGHRDNPPEDPPGHRDPPQMMLLDIGTPPNDVP